MDFRPLDTVEKQKLMMALRGNSEQGHAILMDRQTSFVGTSDQIPDDEVISAIKSVPCHY